MVFCSLASRQWLAALYLAAITSSDPISNTTLVGLVTIPDADTVLDSSHEEASRSIAAVLQPRKRDGTEMAEAGATGVAALTQHHVIKVRIF